MLVHRMRISIVIVTLPTTTTTKHTVTRWSHVH